MPNEVIPDSVSVDSRFHSKILHISCAVLRSSAAHPLKKDAAKARCNATGREFMLQRTSCAKIEIHEMERQIHETST